MDLSKIPSDLHDTVLEIVSRCMVDRTFFVRDVLGASTEDWQSEVLAGLDAGDTRVTIRSAVGVGKTALVSWIGLHFLLFRDDVKVIATSPSFNQLTDGLIPEVNKWIGRLPWWLKMQLTVTTERVTVAPDNEANFMSFRTARKENPETFQGIHASHVLLLVDEASAVPDAVYDAGQGTMSTAGSITVLIGNPTRVTGLFYKTHKRLGDLWKRYVVKAADSSRVEPSFVESMAKMYGVDSQQYKVRVLGEFPEGNADSVIPRDWVESAVGRDIQANERFPQCWGLDPGRGGDPTGFCVTQGNRVIELKELSYENTMVVVGYVKKRWDDLAEKDRPKQIFVDVIGIGAGVYDRLDEMGLPVVAVNVAEMAAMSDRFVRMRAELWWSGREFFETKTCVISDKIDTALVEKFVDQLSDTALKDHSSGKTDVESKRDLKARGLKSPNLADAFLLTLAGDGAVMNGAVRDTSWGKPLAVPPLGIV